MIFIYNAIFVPFQSFHSYNCSFSCNFSIETDGFDHNNLFDQPSQIYDDESGHKEVNENIESSKKYLDIMLHNWILPYRVVSNK